MKPSAPWHVNTALGQAKKTAGKPLLTNKPHYWLVPKSQTEAWLFPYALACLEAGLELSEDARSIYSEIVEAYTLPGCQVIIEDICLTQDVELEHQQGEDINYFTDLVDYFILTTFNRKRDIENRTPKITTDRALKLVSVLYMRSIFDYLGVTEQFTRYRPINFKGTIRDTETIMTNDPKTRPGKKIKHDVLKFFKDNQYKVKNDETILRWGHAWYQARVDPGSIIGVVAMDKGYEGYDERKISMKIRPYDLASGYPVRKR